MLKQHCRFRVLLYQQNTVKLTSKNRQKTLKNAEKGAVAFEKMWQPLNVNSRQLQTESKLSVISSLLF